MGPVLWSKVVALLDKPASSTPPPPCSCRMDVTPLEQFEAAFPFSEAPRLQPLYIEKAALPDILDPLLQERYHV